MVPGNIRTCSNKGQWKFWGYEIKSNKPSVGGVTLLPGTSQSWYDSHLTVSGRVVAKKIVSWLRFSLSRSPFFKRDLEKSFTFTRWRMQYMDREQANKCSKQDYISIILLVIVAPILKVVGNLFQTFHLVGSILNDCTCIT